MGNKGKKIYIANYIKLSGGTLMLSTLCATLRELGWDARMVVRDFNYHGQPKARWKRFVSNGKVAMVLLLNRVPVIACRFLDKRPTTVNIPGLRKNLRYKLLPWFNKRDAVVIYPEAIWGNPLGVENVVRWLLYFNRFDQSAESTDGGDFFVTYRDIFNDAERNPDNNKLYLSFFDHELYRQYNFGQREGNCYILRKGRSRNDLPETFDGPVFNNDMSEKEFVRILNRCEYCYSYDTQTFYNVIAAVCGCTPVVVMEPGKSELDYLAEGESHPGVAYGDSPEQIRYARETRQELLDKLDFDEMNRENVKLFVQLLEKQFGSLRRLDS